MKVNIIGLGSRGKNYGSHLHKTKNIEIVSICDKFKNKVDIAGNLWGVSVEKRFTDENSFFSQGKTADVMVIATQDRDHYSHCIKALNLGYHILVEKPLSPNIKECLEIERFAREKGLKMLVCHVLRYAPYYRKIKELISSKVLGDIIEIRHAENISYWHYSHSYVRGNWRREDETSPLLLAKCCHDLDLLYWFSDSKCKSVNSYGSLKFFKSDNAPEGATEICFTCPNKNTCIYETQYQYLGRKKGVFKTKPKFLWGTYAFCQDSNKQAILDALKNGEKGKQFSRCVFKCDNNVIDNQTVNMEMENGVLCTFSVNAFNEKNHRHTEIRGTKGILIADDSRSVMTLKLFDKKERTIKVNFSSLLKGHYGGDEGIIKALCNILEVRGDYPNYTWIKDTIESHRIVTAAEISRKNGGKTINMKDIPDITN